MDETRRLLDELMGAGRCVSPVIFAPAVPSDPDITDADTFAGMESPFLRREGPSRLICWSFIQTACCMQCNCMPAHQLQPISGGCL